jgi:hypothetical protein
MQMLSGVLITKGSLNFAYETSELQVTTNHSRGSLVTWNHFQKRFESYGRRSCVTARVRNVFAYTTCQMNTREMYSLFKHKT